MNGGTPPSGGITASGIDIAFNRLNFRYIGGSSSLGALRLGTSWADVVPSAIPEPGTYGAAIGLLGLLLAWRRRRG
ncbi:MAG: PEP-CTERM sorting domain-containing protein [Opitutales bacterium]